MESRFNEQDPLMAAVEDFGWVIESSERFCDSTKRLSRALSIFFAMRAAFSICTVLGRSNGYLLESASDGVEGRSSDVEPESLPTLEAVRGAMNGLAIAMASNDRRALVCALEQMGVFALCPNPEKQLARMEGAASYVSGRARLVFLVELSLFATRVRDFDFAGRYVSEAWSLEPDGWELYNLCVLEGLFALNDSDTPEAIRWLKKSIEACQVDEHVSLKCGVRAPNFSLAQKLLELGERVEVLKHLLQCKNVWQSRRMRIDRWVDLVENGVATDFQGCEVVKLMNLSSYMLDKQWMRARFLETAKTQIPNNVRSRSPEEVMAARKRLTNACNNAISTRVKETISYLEKPDTDDT